MHFKTRFYFLTIFIISNSCFGQKSVQELLDSLKTIKVNYIPRHKDDFKKADSLFTRIDTTHFTIAQVDHVLRYKSYHGARIKDIPFPYLQWAYRASKIKKYFDGEIKALSRIADNYRLLHNKEAYVYYEKVKALHKSQKNEIGVAKINMDISLVHYSYREYDKAVTLQLKTLDVYSKLNNNKGLVTLYHNLGDTYLKAGDTLNALKYLTLSDTKENEFSNLVVKAINKSYLGSIFLGRKQLDSAKIHLKNSNNIITKQGVMPYLLPYNSKSLGLIEEANNNLDLALQYYKKAVTINYSRETGKEILVLSATRMANILIQKEKYNDAIFLLLDIEEKYHKAIENGYLKIMYTEFIEFYDLLAIAYEKINNFNKVNHYRKKQINAINKSAKVNTLLNINKLENRYQSKISDQQIQILKTKNTLRTKENIIILLALFFAILLFIIFYFYSIRLAKRKANINRLKLNNEKLKAKKSQQEKEITKLELELKQRKLTTNSISLIQKKEQHKVLLNQLEQFRPSLQKNIKNLAVLNTIISNSKASSTAYNWEEFKITFEDVHQGFYNALLSKHPNLSANEKKICAFLKLGLNTKDISAITQQSVETLTRARSRLRKKIDLKTKESLSNYIAQF